MKRLILLILFTSIAAYSATEWGNLIVKGNLSVNGTGTVGGTSILTQTNTVSGITNKTLTSPAINGANLNFGTATNTNRLLLPTETSTNLDALTDTAGLIAFDTTENKPVYNNGSGWTAIGSGSGGSGGINFVTNGEYEVNITGTNAYQDAAAATPVDGTGGSPTITISRTTTAGEVQRGVGSLKIEKPASNERGEGVSIDIEVDGADNAASKRILITFDFETTSTYTSDEIRMFVYDKDAGGTPLNVLSTTENTSGFLKTCTTGCKFVGEFYTNSGSNSYRIIWHIAGESATAYSVYIDNVRAGPDSPQPTAFDADLGTESWTDSEANATTSVKLTRKGNRIFATGTITFTGGADNDGVINITIPSQYTADSFYSFSNSRSYPVGVARQVDNGTATFESFVNLAGSTTLQMQLSVTNATFLNPGQLTSSQPFTWVSGDSATFEASWYVANWVSGSVLSTTEALQRAAAVIATKTSGSHTSSGNYQDVSWTESVDRFNSFDGTTFTAPKPGLYIITGNVNVDANATGYAVVQITDGSGNLLGYGSGRTNVTAIQNFMPFSAILSLNQGNTVKIRVLQNTGGNLAYFQTSTLAIVNLADLATFGVYGVTEYQETKSSAQTAWPFSAGALGDLGSLSLTPGEWLLDATIQGYNNAAVTAGNLHVGISTISGNNATGLSYGDNRFATFNVGTNGYGMIAQINNYRVVITSTTTYYLKGMYDNTVTNFQYLGYKISARRIK